VRASLRALRKRRNVDTVPSFLSIPIDARDRDIAQSNLTVGQLAQILDPVIESRHGDPTGNPAVAVFRGPSYRGASTAAAKDRYRFDGLGLDGHVFE
jgi:hypothetical protein